MATKTAAIIIIGTLLAGCAGNEVEMIPHTPVPVATNFPTSNQYKLQAAGHWAAIAQHLEQLLAADMKKGPKRPFFIAETPPQASAFQRALAVQLTSALVRDGHVVSRTPAGSLKVDIDVQALTFSPGRSQFRYAGEPTLIAAGVLALAAVAATEPVAGIIAGVAAHDVYRYTHSRFAEGATPQTELLVTVSVSDQYRYYARSSSAYYVADTDRTLYGFPPEPSIDAILVKKYQVKGDK